MTARAEPFSAEPSALTAGRALFRLLRVGGWTAAWSAIWSIGAILGGGWRWTVTCRQRWATALLRAFGVRVVVRGGAPAGAFLLAPNHLGYLDVLVVAAVLPVRFVAKREVAEWPVWGPLARWTGTLFVDRERSRDAHRVAGEIGRALGRGEGVAIFAEGTSTAGEGVLPFRAPLFEGAAMGGTPVVPAALRYVIPSDPGLVRDRVCWWGEMTFAPHLISLAGLPPIEATLTLGTPIVGTDRRDLAARTHVAVERLYRSNRQEDRSSC